MDDVRIIRVNGVEGRFLSSETVTYGVNSKKYESWILRLTRNNKKADFLSVLKNIVGEEAFSNLLLNAAKDIASGNKKNYLCWANKGNFEYNDVLDYIQNKKESDILKYLGILVDSGYIDGFWLEIKFEK